MRSCLAMEDLARRTGDRFLVRMFTRQADLQDMVLIIRKYDQGLVSKNHQQAVRDAASSSEAWANRMLKAVSRRLGEETPLPLQRAQQPEGQVPLPGIR